MEDVEDRRHPRHDLTWLLNNSGFEHQKLNPQNDIILT